MCLDVTCNVVPDPRIPLPPCYRLPLSALLVPLIVMDFVTIFLISLFFHFVVWVQVP